MQRYRIFSYALLIGIIPIQATANCDKYLRANDLTSSARGEKKTALYCYKDMLTTEPNNAKALAGLQEIEARYVKWAKRALRKGQKNKVKRYLDSLRLVNPNSLALSELEAQVYPNRQPQAVATTETPAQPEVIVEPLAQPEVIIEPPAEPEVIVEPPPLKQAKIKDIGQIYEAINTTDCIKWPSPEIKEKGGKSGWGDFYPKNGDTGSIISEMKHCHLEDNIYVVKIDQHYVPITSDGVLVIE